MGMYIQREGSLKQIGWGGYAMRSLKELKA